jgi:formylglycine-generating enzyme required for sulfatase activity
VLRGGGWFNLTLNYRVAYRIGATPKFRTDGFGFRLACSL